MSGVTVQAGWVDRGTTWNRTPGTVDTWLPILSETLTKQFEGVHDEVLGDVSMHKVFNGFCKIEGDVSFALDYVYTPALFEYALGAAAAGVYTMADDLAYFGLEIDKGLQRWRFPSCAVNRMVVSLEPGKVPMVTFGLMASDCQRTTNAFPSLTNTGQVRAVFKDLVFSIADQVDALAGGDAVNVKKVELTLNNNLKMDDAASGNSGYMMEPERNDFRGAQLVFDTPRYDSDNFATWKDGDTDLQALVSLAGSGHTCYFQLPNGKVGDGANANVNGPGVFGDSVTTEWYRGTNTWLTNEQLGIVTT